MRPQWIRPIQISHVALRVRDLQSSAAFYCQLFAMERRPAVPPGDDTCICVTHAAPSSPSFGIVLIQGLPDGAQPVGMDHLSLKVAKTEDVEDIYCAAIARGAEATEPRNYSGHYQTFIFDPDGHKIEVVAGELPPRADVQDFDKRNAETRRTRDVSPLREDRSPDAAPASLAAGTPKGPGEGMRTRS